SGVVYASLALGGVTNIPLAHGMLIFAWAFSIFVTYTAEPYWDFARKYRLLVTLGLAFGLGGLFAYFYSLEKEPPKPLKAATQAAVQQDRKELQQLRASFDRTVPKYNDSAA